MEYKVVITSEAEADLIYISRLDRIGMQKSVITEKTARELCIDIVFLY